METNTSPNLATPDTSKQQQPNKRIVFITGDKGGVGKSFTARALVQYYIDHEIPFRGFDIDPVNSNLAQFYPAHTRCIDIQEPGALDEIRNELEAHDLIAVDCAARTIGDLDIWFRDMSLFEEKHQLRLSLTFAFVITPDKSCTVIMSDALKRFGREARYFVVKNLAKGKDFSIFDGSQLRERLHTDFEAAELALPPLLQRTVVILDSHDIGFGEAAQSQHCTIADRSRVRGFLAMAYREFDTVKSILVP